MFLLKEDELLRNPWYYRRVLRNILFKNIIVHGDSLISLGYKISDNGFKIFKDSLYYICPICWYEGKLYIYNDSRGLISHCRHTPTLQHRALLFILSKNSSISDFKKCVRENLLQRIVNFQLLKSKYRKN